MYEKPKKFTRMFLLVTLVSILIIVLALALASSANELMIIFAAILVLADLITLIVFTVIALVNVIKNIFQGKTRMHSFRHLFNLVLSIFVTGLILLFTFTIVAGTMIILLPFLA